MRMGQLKGRINRVKGIVNRLEEMIELSTTKRGSTGREGMTPLSTLGEVISNRMVHSPKALDKDGLMRNIFQ
jgi:hypothetical protein